MDERANGRYTVKELADRGGVTPRTVYYYVGEGLLPAPEGGGPASTYTDDHLLRLRLIRRLKAEYLPLAEIRRRLADLTTDELRALLEAPTAAPPQDSARAYLARLLGDTPAAGPPSRPSAPRASPAAFARPAPASPPAPRPARPSERTDDRPTEESYPALRGPLPESARPLQEAGGASARRPADAADVAPSESWQRVRIAPDVELHVRAADTPSTRSRLGRMVEALRRVLET